MKTNRSDPAARLLLVEDEAHLAVSLRFNLLEEGYHVDVAETIGQARELLKERFDVIILDVMLPDGNGFEFCRELRNQGDLTPVLMLTALSASEDIVRGLTTGADDYVAKPFSLHELFGRVTALLRRQQWDGKPSNTTETDEVSFGGNTVDFGTHLAKTNHETVELTDLELRLLRYFVENVNRVVSRSELLKDVWDVSPKTNTRTVDNFIVRLRRLFEVDPAKPKHFVTVRGVGYRFVLFTHDASE